MRTPNYSTSQRIGTLGKRVFQGGHPDAWFAESEPTQNSDFGFDMSMLIESTGRINGRFAVQLKTGANTHIAGQPGAQYIQVPLKPESCNLYLQDGQPILLVYIALENENSTTNASMYYLWIEESLRERLGGRSQFDDSDPAEMTFRIPIENELTKNLDITPFLNDYWDSTRTLQSLRNEEGMAALATVSCLSPRSQVALAATNPKDLDRWLSNEALSGDSLWATPKPGSAAAKIRQINDALNRSDAIEASRIVREVEDASLTDPEVLAEFRYQQGRLALLNSDAPQAREYFSQASALNMASARFVAAEVEAAVVCRIEDDSPLSSDLLDRAQKHQNTDEVAFQLVRVFALEEQYAEAERALLTIKEPMQTRARALYHTVRHEWDEVLRVANEGLAKQPDSRAESFLKILRLRALLNVATADSGFISVGGPPELKAEDALELKDATMEFLRQAREDGWPSNAAMSLDCASAVCVYFGPDKELLELVVDFARKRPTAPDVQETVARVATFLGEQDVAVAALQKIHERDAANTARLVLLLAESDRHLEAVDVAMTSLLHMPHDELIDMAAAAAAASAYRLGSTKEEITLRDFVDGGSVAARSLLRFITDSLRYPERRREHLEQLWNDAAKSTDNTTLQDNLIQYLRPDQEADVDRILELCRRTAKRRNLTEMESAKFAVCLLRRESFTELLDFTARALRFYPSDESLGLSRAIALEKIGQPSAAEQVLRRFDKSVRRDVVAARTQLLLRVGDIDAIISLTQRALAAATDHGEKFHYQRTLATLQSRRDRGDYLEAAWRLGEVVDQSIEIEEGAFLIHFLMATSGPDFDIAVSRIEEFQRRVTKFVERFPNSTILRVGHMREDATPMEMLDGLRSLAGITPEKSRAQERMRNLGERSGSHIPFALRPRNYVPFASNLADLVRIFLNTWHVGESSRLIVGDHSFPERTVDAPPIVDLTTLFVLVELNLWDRLFEVWGAVAVPRESLAALTDLMFGPRDEGNARLLDGASDAIRRHRDAIVQPGLESAKTTNYPLNEFETIRAEVESGRYCYLTIDLAAASILFAEVGYDRCYTLWNAVEAMVERRVITTSEATTVRLVVASWNTVGVPVSARDIVGASLGAAPRGADDRSPYARAVRNFLSRKDVTMLLKDVAQVLVSLLSGDDSTAPDAARWFLRILYVEAVLARSLGFNGSVDELTGRLAVLCVINAGDEDGALATIESLWVILDDSRGRFGGSPDKDAFYRLVGRWAADLLDKIVKAHGLGAIQTEARFTELLFSLARSGTQDRHTLEEAYFERTRQLHSR